MRLADKFGANCTLKLLELLAGDRNTGVDSAIRSRPTPTAIQRHTRKGAEHHYGPPKRPDSPRAILFEVLVGARDAGSFLLTAPRKTAMAATAKTRPRDIQNR